MSTKNLYFTKGYDANALFEKLRVKFLETLPVYQTPERLCPHVVPVFAANSNQPLRFENAYVIEKVRRTVGGKSEIVPNLETRTFNVFGQEVQVKGAIYVCDKNKGGCGARFWAPIDDNGNLNTEVLLKSFADIMTLSEVVENLDMSIRASLSSSDATVSKFVGVNVLYAYAMDDNKRLSRAQNIVHAQASRIMYSSILNGRNSVTTESGDVDITGLTGFSSSVINNGVEVVGSSPAQTAMNLGALGNIAAVNSGTASLIQTGAPVGGVTPSATGAASAGTVSAPKPRV